MATKVSMLSQLVRFASIVWFKDKNQARPTGDYGKVDELIGSLVEHGWRHNGDGTIDVERITPELLERATRERSQAWDSLQAAAKADVKRATERDVFAEIYVNPESGKLYPIELQGISGNRRSTAFEPAMLIRRKEGLPLTDQIPVIVKEYKSPLERLDDQIRENEGKTLGFMEMTPIDQLLAAKQAVELGATEKNLRNTFKDGTGQKLWGIITLDKRFPQLSIISRMRLTEASTDYLSVRKPNKEDLRKLCNRSNPKWIESENKSLALAGKPLIPIADADEVAKYFLDTKTNGSNAQKIMKKDNIEGFSTSSPVDLFKKFANAVLTDNTNGLVQYNAQSVGYNTVGALSDQGFYPQTEMVLVGILQCPQKEEAFKQIEKILNQLSAQNKPQTNKTPVEQPKVKQTV